VLSISVLTLYLPYWSFLRPPELFVKKLATLEKRKDFEKDMKHNGYVEQCFLIIGTSSNQCMHLSRTANPGFLLDGMELH